MFCDFTFISSVFDHGTCRLDQRFVDYSNPKLYEYLVSTNELHLHYEQRRCGQKESMVMMESGNVLEENIMQGIIKFLCAMTQKD